MLDPIASAPSPEWMADDELLPWSWAVTRLQDERNYWLVTVRRDGFPQARPVWGVWSEVGLFLSVGHGGLQRADVRRSMPITVHTDDAVDVVIVEGIIDRVGQHPDPHGANAAAVDVDPAVRRSAVERYNAKYSWDFDLSGDGLNFLVRPEVAYGWRSTPKAVKGGTKWSFSSASQG